MNRDAADVFRRAEEPIRAVAQATVPQVAHALLFRVKNAATYHERSVVSLAQSRFVEAQELFLSGFGANLHEGVEAACGAGRPDGEGGAKKPKGATDWMSIGLVDEDKVEESIGAKRIGQLIAHAADRELRELDGYACAVLGLRHADAARNPLGADVIGAAVQKSIERISDDPITQKVLSREVAQTIADAMPGCYKGIIELFVKAGVRPVSLPLKAVSDAGTRRPESAGIGDLRRTVEDSWKGQAPSGAQEALRSWEQSILGRIPRSEPLPPGSDVPDAAALLDRLMRGVLPAPPQRAPGGTSLADQQLTEMLRRLANASDAADSPASPPPSAPVPSAFAPTRPGEYTSAGWAGLAPDARAPGLDGLVAANLIRAHHAELVEGARTKVDHLVIEVVASLFDQILSDSRVPPHFARQIARLQLPVLRVALDDPRFFSSRRHPLRRFINRVASLGVAVDDFGEAIGASLLARVSALVSEIVEGDFSELEVYDAKLDALQAFVAEQVAAEVAESRAGSTLRDKEGEVQQVRAFGSALAAALEPLGLPAVVRDFICGPWSQAIVVATRRDGADAEAPQALRQTVRELVFSLQPKRTLEERKRFISTLPALMGALKDGMAAVGWPEPRRDAFFGELMTLHAGSLKAPLSSDLDHNLRMRQLDQAVRLPVPVAEVAGAAVDQAAAAATSSLSSLPSSSLLAPTPAVAALPPVAELEALEPVLTPEEQHSIGLVAESAVDWTSRVDVGVPAAGGPAPIGVPPTPAIVPAIDLAIAPAPGNAPAPASAGASPDALPTIDVAALDAPQATVAPPVGAAASAAPIEVDPELATGASLREHLQLGLSYQLNLSGRWEKVRLTYMSPSRTLFMFAHGAKDRQSVSMTARTLQRLCEAGRMRAAETAYLVERSTERTRATLAGRGLVAG